MIKATRPLPKDGVHGSSLSGNGTMVPKTESTSNPTSMWQRAKPYVVPVLILAVGGFGSFLLYRFFFNKKRD
jgi:hypothetical protein